MGDFNNSYQTEFHNNLCEVSFSENKSIQTLAFGIFNAKTNRMTQSKARGESRQEILYSSFLYGYSDKSIAGGYKLRNLCKQYRSISKKVCYLHIIANSYMVYSM